MQYKAIISDIDGTLIGQGKIFSFDTLPTKRVTDAIFQVKEHIHVGVATSRPLEGVGYVFDHLSLTGPSILYGGSVIVDAQTKQVVWEQPLSTNAAKEIVSIAQKYHIDFRLHEDIYSEVINNNTYVPKSAYNIYLAELSAAQAQEIHEMLKKIPDIAIHKTSSWTSHLFAFDITHAEATKQHGVLQVAKILGIRTDEIIAIGDGYNDFPLLMAAGLKVAMGNAVSELKAIADYVAPPVEEDGVVDIIEKFVL